jgi:hypothetical protein
VLILRFAFTLLLYLFLFRLVAALRRDLGRAARQSASPERPARRALEGRLVVLNGAGAGLETGQSFPLEPVTIIGRAPSSQILLNDGLVSAQHARLRRRDARWFIQDLNSTNGTLLNQQRLRGEQPIEYGDMIAIGGVRLKLAR